MGLTMTKYRREVFAKQLDKICETIKLIKTTDSPNEWSDALDMLSKYAELVADKYRVCTDKEH